MSDEAVFNDADFLFAIYNPDDSHYSQARDLLQKSQDYFSVVYISLLVIHEVATLVGQRVGKIESIDFLDTVHSSAFTVVYPDEMLVKSAEQIFRSIVSKNVSYADCVSFAIMKQYGIKWALSFDIHFKKQGFKRVGIDGMPKVI